jgi:N-acetylmuramoyl-L-alanine amidase
MKNLLVIIDNGHGVNTKGKCAPDKSLYEWEWTREIALHLYKQLTLNGIESILLVPEDTDIPLSERVKREKNITKQAKKAGKETCLISIHIDAADKDGKWKTARGWSVRVSPKSSANSKKLAQLLYAEAEARGLQGDRYVPKEKYWIGDYTILNDTSCPAVLTENMFQDNKKDVEYLLSDKGKMEIVDLHFDAIINYMNS